MAFMNAFWLVFSCSCLTISSKLNKYMPSGIILCLLEYFYAFWNILCLLEYFYTFWNNLLNLSTFRILALKCFKLLLATPYFLWIYSPLSIFQNPWGNSGYATWGLKCSLVCCYPRSRSYRPVKYNNRSLLKQLE